ncbi:MAG: chemotaxis protein CheD [Methanomethylovorans sp.]|uniref:chemotaxis protein CheD n=1 Tax=Methanomethylovorans sp. TaxID=2758717 RepID=UPI000A556D66|nr:chemotaxis protein CheD [Methanomethylovorans sp.]
MIVIGMADYAVSRSPEKLTTLGLGSCVGIALYDPVAKIGGLIHIMLPTIENARFKDNCAKFADSGIPCLIEEMIRIGAVRRRLVAKIAGGAKMFSFNSDASLNIGERNVQATKMVLSEMKVPLISEDVGKNYGRTVLLDTDTGVYYIKSAIMGENII